MKCTKYMDRSVKMARGKPNSSHTIYVRLVVEVVAAVALESLNLEAQVQLKVRHFQLRPT